jgi:hypothetical protein
LEVQFKYKAEGSNVWKETGWVTQNGSGAHTFVELITNLSANTTYYFTAMLRYVGTELNGTWLNFTTSREPIPPTVWTGNATNASVATTTLNRGYELSAKTTYYSMAKTEKATCVPATNVTLDMGFDFHDYSSVLVQFRYKAEGATGWTDTGWVEQNGSGTHTYAKQITNLSPNTTYYYMAMLLYEGMAVNGSVQSFTTCRELIKPTVMTEKATNVSVAAASLNMAFEFNDYSPVNVQFRYKAEGASAWNETGWVTRKGSGADKYAEPLANLSYVTTYYFRAQLQYDSIVIEGAEKSLTTLERPAVHTKTATNITDAAAALNMAFDFKDFRQVQVQFRYKAEGASVWNETKWVSQSGFGFRWYTGPIANLSSDTTYHFKARLRYDNTVLEGVERSFTTLEQPTVITKTASDITDVSARLNMAFDLKDYKTVQVQFRYKAEGASAWNATGLVVRNGSDAHTFAEPIANLTENTTYYFMALLFYDGVALNGTEVNFTTSREPIPPTVWTGNATDISPTSATRDMGFELSAKNTYYSMAKTEKAICVPATNVTLDMGFDFHDYSSVLVQFRYKAEGAIGWTDTGWVQQKGSGTHTYAKPIANLSHNTTYYYMAMLLYDGMAVNGSVQSFTTCREPIPPTVVTENATNVSAATATLNMAFESNNYSSVQVQFRYKAEGVSTWKETGWVSQNGSGAHTFAVPIANLTYVTTYYYQAMLQYESTVIEGAEKSFMTLEPPVVHTKTATNITDATATLNMAFDLNDYNSVQVQFRYKAKGASVWNDTAWVSQNCSGFNWYREPIAGLSPSTLYEFKALLRYDGTVIEGPKRSFSTMERPTVSTKNAIVQKLPRGWVATLKMDYDFKDYDLGYVRFAYKKVGDTDWEHTDWIGTYHSASYDELIRGLEDHTTYYFYAQLKYGDENNIKGVTLTFKTLVQR